MIYLRAHIGDAQITVRLAHLGRVWVYVLMTLTTSQGTILAYRVTNSVVKLPQPTSVDFDIRFRFIESNSTDFWGWLGRVTDN